MTHSRLIDGIQLTSDSSPRPSRIDRFIVHHAATTSLAAILSLFQPGGRTVSANYALGNDGTLILAVDEDRRAWTSASSYWDGRAVTIEVANSVAGGSWPVSDVTFDKLARLIADVATRYNFPINDDTILTHQELYIRYGDSYATSCPGDLQRRKGELINKANFYRAFPGTAGGDVTPIEEEEEMTKVISRNGILHFVDELGVTNIPSLMSKDMGNQETVDALKAVYGQYEDHGARSFDLIAALAERRWSQKRKQIVDEVVAQLKPLIEELKNNG